MEGAYNLRVIEYANGTVQIRKYSTPVNAVFDTETSVTPVYQKPKKRERPKMLNPFTEELEIMYDLNNSDRSAKNSLNRTREKLYTYSRQADWEWFITLTFDGSKVDRYDFSGCMKKANQWFKHQHQRYASDLMYLFVPEQHKDGAWHIHGVLSNTGCMKFEDSGRVAIGKKAYVRTAENAKYPTIYNLSGWRFGWSTATAVRDKHKVATYIVKYMTKELCEVTKGKKRYYRSRNIPEPNERGFIVEPHEYDQFMQTLEDSLGLNLVYQKEVSGTYNTVNYRFYQEEREDKKNGKN